MNNTILTTFNQMFKALEHAYAMDDPAFVGAVFEYASFIGATPQLSRIVKQMAVEEDIDPVIFFRLFMYGALRNGFRNQKLKKEDIGIPLFMDKAIDEKYGFLRKFLELLESEKENAKKAQRESTSIFDFVDENSSDDPHSITNEQELFKFRILHNQILARAIQSDHQPPRFDEGTGVLYINDQPVRFRKFTEQYHCLRIIFESKENLNEERFFSEIAEGLDSAKEYSGKKIHNYVTGIKNRIAAEVGVRDLLITTNQSVRINDTYLINLK